MATKVILLFLLITGVFTFDLKADVEFDRDLLGSEDYDTVEENYEDDEEDYVVDVKARGMEDDIALLDEESQAEMHDFCSQAGRENDIVCQTMGLRK